MPGDRGGEESVRPIVQLQGRPDEQQLGESVRMEREGHLARDDLVGARDVARSGSGDERRAGIGDDPPRQLRPGRSLGVPGEPQLGESRRRRPAGRRANLGRGQQVGERVEVVADTDATFGAGLERGRAAPGEWIEDHVARARIASDERMGQGRGEAREVRAHRVERVAPQPLLGLPLGCERDDRQLERELERELACGSRSQRRSVRTGSGRHRRVDPSLTRTPIVVVGAMGRGV